MNARGVKLLRLLHILSLFSLYLCLSGGGEREVVYRCGKQRMEEVAHVYNVTTVAGKNEI